MRISDAVIKAKTRQKRPKKRQRPENRSENRPKTKTALFRANKHLEKFIISNCRSV